MVLTGCRLVKFSSVYLAQSNSVQFSSAGAGINNYGRLFVKDWASFNRWRVTSQHSRPPLPSPPPSFFISSTFVSPCPVSVRAVRSAELIPSLALKEDPPPPPPPPALISFLFPFLYIFPPFLYFQRLSSPLPCPALPCVRSFVCSFVQRVRWGWHPLSHWTRIFRFPRGAYGVPRCEGLREQGKSPVTVSPSSYRAT